MSLPGDHSPRYAAKCPLRVNSSYMLGRLRSRIACSLGAQNVSSKVTAVCATGRGVFLRSSAAAETTEDETLESTFGPFRETLRRVNTHCQSRLDSRIAA